MTLITADFILTCNEGFEIIEDGAMLFDERIIEVGKCEELKAKHPTATIIETPQNSVILPGLINAHVHLEFSANQSMLRYGDFIVWLQSVIKHREELSALATTELIGSKLQEMLKTLETCPREQRGEGQVEKFQLRKLLEYVEKLDKAYNQDKGFGMGL